MLDLSQQYAPGSIPLLGSEYRVSSDLETGELLRQQVIGFQREGSYDTSLHIRSDGTRVSCSGNPSSYNRPDNLYGYDDIEKALNVYNQELVILGLPALRSYQYNVEKRKPTKVIYDTINDRTITVTRNDYSHNESSIIKDGRARINRIDITENISTNNAVDFIRHLSSYVHHGKIGNLYPNGRTVDWGKGSRRIYQKYYDKAFDIELKINKLTKRLNGQNKEHIEKHIEYLLKLKEWCQHNGIVRRETTFKSTELIDRKRIYINDWSISEMTNIIEPYQFHKKLHIEETRFQGVYEKLLQLGYPDRQCKQAELIHTAWIQSNDYKRLCGSQPTFYRYRKMLLNVGVDIMNPCDISRITLRAHKAEWKEIEPPKWYQLPNQNKIDKIAA